MAIKHSSLSIKRKKQQKQQEKQKEQETVIDTRDDEIDIDIQPQQRPQASGIPTLEQSNNTMVQQPNILLPTPPRAVSNCILCPYGGNASIAAVFSGIAVLFSFVACYGCALFAAGGPGSPMHGTVGYYYYNDQGTTRGATCKSLIALPPPGDGNNHVDGFWRLGRGVPTVLTFLGIFNFVNISIVSCCMRLLPSYIRFAGYTTFLTGLLHPLLFIGLLSNFCEYYNCQLWASGSILAVCSAVAWLVASAVLLYGIKPRVTQNDLQAQEQLQQYNQQLQLILNQQQQQQFPYSSLEQPQPVVEEEQQGIVYATPVTAREQFYSNTGEVSTIEVVETPHIDGTMSRTTTTTTTSPDGSKTIKITTENNLLHETVNQNVFYDKTRDSFPLLE